MAEDVQGLSWIDESITATDRRRYYYRLKAYDELGNSSVSDLVTALGVSDSTGVVSTSDGRSPAGAELSLQAEHMSNSIILDGSGSFSFTNLEEGSYT